MNSIYDKFLSIRACNYYCNQIAQKLNLTVSYSYFFDNHTKKQYKTIRDCQSLSKYSDNSLKFNLSSSIRNMGAEQYVEKHHKIVFYLMVTGFCISYTVKFSPKKVEENHNEPVVHKAVIDSSTSALYIEDANQQLTMVFN